MPRGLSIGLFLASAIHTLGADSTSVPAIGLVRASGEFTIDGSEARDNSTVFHGSVISTTRAASHVVLEDGTRIDIGLDSRSRVYRDHLAIEQGLVHVNASNRYVVIAGRIRIDSPKQTLVRVGDSGTVAVTVLQGTTEVKNGRGMLVAMVPPGRTLEFSDADTTSDDASVTGCLERIENRSGPHTDVHYVLEDQTTNVVVELVGTGLERFVSNTVEATGPIDPSIRAIRRAAYVIHPASLIGTSKQKCTGPVGTTSRQAPPAVPGLSGLAKAGVIGGIAVGGTVGGLLAADVIGGGATATSPSPASR
jgi:hypothetical protein